MEDPNLKRSLKRRFVMTLKNEFSYNTLQWMKTRGMFNKIPKCESCNFRMILKECTSGIAYHKFCWICSVRCNKNVTCRNIRYGSIFSNHIELGICLIEWIKIIYYWSVNESYENIMRKTGIKGIKISSVLQTLRTICVQYFEDNEVRLGGDGRTVLIVKNIFDVGPITTLGLIDISDPVVGHLQVTTLDENSIRNIRERVVLPGSIVREESIENEAVKLYYDKHWKVIKTGRENMNLFLNQAMWLDRFGDEVFRNICQQGITNADV